MQRQEKAAERDTRHHFESVFRSCKEPRASMAEFKTALLASKYGKQLESHKWFQQTEDEQHEEINLYITREHALIKSREKLGSDTNPTNEEILQMFYRCESTLVLTKEFIHNMKHAKVGARRPGDVKDPVPRRNEYPRIIDTRLFVDEFPTELSWPQFRLFCDKFYRFCEIVGQVDDEYYLLQYKKTELYVPEKHVPKHRLRREIKDYHHVIVFCDFFSSLAEHVLPLNVCKVPGNTHSHDAWTIDEENSHVFWSTRTGHIWFDRYHLESKQKPDTPTYITWEEVYRGKQNWGDNGLRAILPNIAKYSLTQIMNLFPQHYKPADNVHRFRTRFTMSTGVMEIMDEDQSVPVNAAIPDPDLPLDDTQVVDRYETVDDCDSDGEDNNDDGEKVPKKPKRSLFSRLFRRGDDTSASLEQPDEVESEQPVDMNYEDSFDTHQHKVGQVQQHNQPVLFKTYRDRAM